MPSTFAVVDLFAGPGGLGEGLSAFCDPSGHHPFSIEISIENDPAAHATLRLRSFLRKFGTEFPAEYHDFLNGRLPDPDWSQLYPKHWAAAENEARLMELGTNPTSRFLSARIKEIRRKHHNRTVLIGGPPCQAYSLVGRARNAGIAGYVPHKDERNFLYQQYVDVLRQLKPMAFVMENVKGVLSSAIRGDMIFRKMMADLESAAGRASYQLFALAPEEAKAGIGRPPTPQDFIVRMEEHGVPQARHRVIILGLRRDIADKRDTPLAPRLRRITDPVTVEDVIGAMPWLRSGLSRDDELAAWRKAVTDAVRTVSGAVGKVPKEGRGEFRTALAECRAALRARPKPGRASKRGTGIPDSCPDALYYWLADPNLKRLPNNDTRGHMPSDLARYLFVAAFGRATGRSPKSSEFPAALAPNHRNWGSGKFTDRFKVQVATKPASTVTSHISKDGHYFIHPDPSQCRSLTVREAARLQTFPDNYFFMGNRTQQYVQVGNAVPPLLAVQIAETLWKAIASKRNASRDIAEVPKLEAIYSR